MTSIKSIDLNAAVYQNDQALTYRLNNYFDKISEFNGADFAGDTVTLNKITGRVLNLIVPKGGITDTQTIIIETARMRAKALERPVDLVITQF